MIEKSLINAAIDINPDSYYKFMAGNNNFKIYECEKYSYVMSGKNVWGNNVFGLKNISKDLIDELKQKIINKEMPVMVSPGMKNTNQYNDRIFLAGGFQKKDTLYAMALERENFKYKNINHELIIKKCEKIEEFNLWSEIVVTHLLKKPGSDNITDYANIAYNSYAKNKGNSTYTAFIGYYKNIPVATSVYFVENGIGGIYCVAVPDKFRGKGFGYEITAACINDGIKNGIFSYILHATDSGKNVYKKLGFEEASVVNRYMLQL